eukprot:349824-Chlamydomonas_euryale.AAC.7
MQSAVACAHSRQWRSTISPGRPSASTAARAYVMPRLQACAVPSVRNGDAGEGVAGTHGVVWPG